MPLAQEIGQRNTRKLPAAEEAAVTPDDADLLAVAIPTVCKAPVDGRFSTADAHVVILGAGNRIELAAIAISDRPFHR